MGGDGASADAEREKARGGRAPAREEERAATSAAAAAGPAGPLVRPKAVVGGADDDVERKADAAADRVMRMPDPVPGPAAGPPTTGGLGAAHAPPDAIKRSDDPAAEQRVPGSPAVKPVGTGATGGLGPDTATPAGPAPLVSPPISAGRRPAESATPAPEPEPPAPEGEAPARGTPAVSPELQDYLDASRGKGAPLPDAVRKEFEAKFQRPFDDVRVHDDAGADDAARTIDALAFTRGTDIYFRSGAYDPATQGGRRLLAHELAHVVQNRPGINRRAAPGRSVIRRKAGNPKKPKKGPEGKIEGSTVSIAALKVPKFKVTRSGAGPYVVRKGTREENPTKQASVWRSKAKQPAVAAVAARLTALKAGSGAQSGDPAYYLKLKGEDFFLIGTDASIASDVRTPVWDKDGDRRSFDIDHKREAQLGGLDDQPTGNLWLLDSAKNRSAGSTIRQNIEQTLHEFITLTVPTLDLPSSPSAADVRDPKKNWTLQFEKLVGEGADVKDAEWWEVADFEAADSKLLKHFKFASLKEVEKLRGSPTKLSIFDRASGGGVRHIKRTGDVTEVKDWKAGEFQITGVKFTEDDVGKGSGYLTGTAFGDKGPMQKADLKVPLKKLTGVNWGGVATPGAIDYWRARAFSPISFPEPEFDVAKGIVGRARIEKPSIPLLENVEFSIVFDGDLSIEAEVSGSDLKLPGPFKVTGGMLMIRAGTGGVAVTGDVYFELTGLARGHIGASAKKGIRPHSDSFAVRGDLDFDSKMFSEAHLDVSYIDSKWGVEGRLAVAENQIKGIKSATASVQVSDETVTATGEFVPALKGVEKGTLGFKYDEATGMEITGEILIGQGIPGIKSGRLGATIKEGPDKHSLSGDVMIEPAIPGVTGQATGRYDDGAFAVDAQLGYEHGFAKGTVHLGVTNQPVGADGKPAGEPKKDGSLTVWGDGQVTLQLTPWLVGTVGLKLTPDGQVEVSGEVALPPTFTVFDEKKIEKTLLAIHVDIPIVGVAVAGQRIGIFATIGGDLKIDAGIGPGLLRDVALKVTYNPAKPEATTVTGNATFAVPALAALRLTVEGAVGAGIPVVSAKAGLQVYGEIGVAGEASAGAVVTWTPVAGVVLDARGEIFVEPKFKFGVDAFVDVSADLWVTTIELYHETWHLAAFEYGSNLRFGLAMPIHYESGKPFDISFDQIQWTYPRIEPAELIGGLVKQIVG